MRISNGGNVGIGTTTPGEKLTVNGSIKITQHSVDSNATKQTNQKLFS